MMKFGTYLANMNTNKITCHAEEKKVIQNRRTPYNKSN